MLVSSSHETSKTEKEPNFFSCYTQQQACSQNIFSWSCLEMFFYSVELSQKHLTITFLRAKSRERGVSPHITVGNFIYVVRYVCSLTTFSSLNNLFDLFILGNNTASATLELFCATHSGVFLHFIDKLWVAVTIYSHRLIGWCLTLLLAERLTWCRIDVIVCLIQI